MVQCEEELIYALYDNYYNKAYLQQKTVGYLLHPTLVGWLLCPKQSHSAAVPCLGIPIVSPRIQFRRQPQVCIYSFGQMLQSCKTIRGTNLARSDTIEYFCLVGNPLDTNNHYKCSSYCWQRIAAQ